MNFIKTVAVLFSTVSAVRIKNTSYDKSKARVHICINYKVENCLSAYFFGLNCYHPKFSLGLQNEQAMTETHHTTCLSPFHPQTLRI
jgi:hypothetical protein